MNLVLTQEFVAETCFNCGVAFGMTKEFCAGRHRDQKTFYCPNGHGPDLYGDNGAYPNPSALLGPACGASSASERGTSPTAGG